MLKKLLNVALLSLSLIFFVSCQEQGQGQGKDSKDTKSYQRYRDRSQDKKKCPPCHPDRKCCENDAALPKEEKNILSNEVKSKEALPLEDLKASIEKQNKTSDITKAEKDTFDLEN
jgi:hypothetical protein